MKKVFITIAISIVYIFVQAQQPYPAAPPAPGNITAIEYFLDANPMPGNGTALTGFTASPNISGFDGVVNLTGLTPGLHRIYFRTKDVNGTWSLSSNSFFDNYNLPVYSTAPPAATNIVQLEYFIDNNDLGFGNCTPIAITPGTDISNLSANINITGLTHGVHRLFIRAKDAEGKWSLINYQIFDNSSAPNYPAAPAPVANIVQMEYFFDNNDLGFGNCTPIAVTPGTDISNLNTNIDLNGLTPGVHRVFIRGKDADGKWSLINYQEFDNSSVNPYSLAPALPTAITNMEYFIDTDPGLGKGINVPLTAGTDVKNISFIANINGLPDGKHILFIRSEDANGSWSITNVSTFSIGNAEAAPDLVVQNVTSGQSDVAPGDTITVSWNVANIGALPSPVTWTEKIYLQSTDGQNRTQLKQTVFANDEVIDTGKNISRSDKVAIPSRLAVGDQGVLVVQLIPGINIHEAPGSDTNNTGISQAAITIRKLLTLQLSANQITKGSQDGITATVTRSGSLADPLTVNISLDHPERFSFPSSVTIPQWQSGNLFTISALSNSAIEGIINDTAQVSAVSFQSAKVGFDLLDSGKASLSITDLPSAAMKGSTVNFQVATNLASATPIQVFLTSSNQARFPVPSSVTIPAGALSMNVTVNLVQDSLPALDLTITISAGASNQNSVSSTILVKDNNLPGLELILQTNIISEGAGLFATQATLRRTASSSQIPFTANLSSDLANTLILPASISLAAGEQEKTFNIGVIDNTVVEGQRQVLISASIFVASCGCSAPPASAGSVAATLNVSDNDGPALQLSATPLTLGKARANAGLLRVARNTSTDVALTVNLSSSNTNEATVPATTSIPIGQQYIDVPITTLDDGVTDSSERVYFQANTSGFSMGQVWVIVTNLNKPDLQIPAVTMNSSSVQTNTVINYQVSVKNTGLATAPGGVMVQGYLSLDNVIDNSDSLITKDIIPGTITVGQTIQIVDSVIAPDLPGKYKLIFEVNPTLSLSELLLTNNTSQPVDLTINPSYTAIASVNSPYFLKGNNVPVTGSATNSDGTPAYNVQVEVQVITNGLRRQILATTDGLGNYTTEFTPLTNEVGHYTVGAGFPGMKDTVAQDAFDIPGVIINGNTIPKFNVILSDTLRGSLSVQNLSNTNLNQFSLTNVNLPNSAYIRFDTLSVLAGNTTVNIGYTIAGSSLSPGTNFEVANLQAVANEGIIQPVEVFYFCQAPNGFIVADISSININASQSSGGRKVEFRLVNNGSGATGNVAINLPQVNWLSSITPINLPSMSPGDTTLVILKFSTLPEVPFNFPIKGNIGISSQHGNSVSIPFSFQKVSDSTGNAKITVTDQFTYYTQAAPKVADAHVIVKNYYTGVVYAEGYTDSTGIFSANGLPEGILSIAVDKDKHLPYSGTITINPDDTANSTVFINYQAVTFSWSVIPTAIQDQYDITLTTQFETNVPVPVVTIDMPKSMPQLSGNDDYAFNITLTNHGLITAKDVTLNLPTEDAEYEFITNYVPADLLAQQSIQVPVIMHRRDGQHKVGRKVSIAGISQFLGMNTSQYRTMAPPDLNCKDFAGVVYWYKCNLTTGLWQKGGTLFTYTSRVCGSSIIRDSILIPYDPSKGGNVLPTCATCPCDACIAIGTSSTPPVVIEKKNCVQCLNELAQAIAGCLGKDIPIPVTCFMNMIAEKGGPKTVAICLLEENVNNMVKKILSEVPYISKILCLKDLLSAFRSCLSSAVERKFENRNYQRPNKAETLDNALIEINNNLEVVKTAYNVLINWNTEYFGDLSLSDSWSHFSSQIVPYVENFDSIPKIIQDSIIADMSGYDMQLSAIQSFFVRWNNSIQAYDQNILTPNSQYPDIINWSLVKSYSDSLVDFHNYAVGKGFQSVEDMHSKSFKSLNEILDNQKEAVCASVTVQLSQKLTMTREAFEGTLDIFNGHPTDKMDSLSVNIQITDVDGVPSNGLFGIQIKSLTNLSDMTGTGAIAAQQTGRVKFLFIPGIDAALQTPQLYNFGGTVRYWDPFAKAMVTLPLAQVQLTVNPSPNLMLHYFMQRNILGDDALTTPEIEPSVPAELGVMVVNQGYGPAVNLTISSAQPKIVDNEKGLAINFNLIGSNLQGKPEDLGLTNIDFGTIPPLQARVGEWYFTSSLLGKFVSYEANVVHNNSFGNPGMSLVKGIKLHELTKSIREFGALDDGINDFMVNDIFDIHNVPDIIYFSQGNRTAKVFEATSGSFSSPVTPPAFTNTLTVTASASGWNYIELNDPGNRQYDLVSVTRRDGQVIPLDNAWLTFVTLPVSQPPVYENKFHFVDIFPSLAPVTYTVVWKPKNIDVPKVINITGVPAEVTSTQVQKLTILFSKSIDPATFTYQDLALTFQGGPDIMNSSVIVNQVDSTTFSVDLSALTTGNGFYNFTVQAANVKDIYGLNGLAGKQATWTQFLTVPSVQAFQGIPAGNMATAYDTIDILFNLPVDVSSVTPARFTIYKDGVVQQGTLIIDSVRADHKMFYLSGLKNILTRDGVYEFKVDLPNIKSENQISGVQTQSLSLTVDNTGPVVVSLEKSNTGGLDSQHINFVNIKFNKKVVGFNTASVQLTRDGVILPLNIYQLSNTDLETWMAGNFSLLTYPNGNYTLTVNTTGFTDLIGNHGNSSKQISWTVNRSSLVTISNLAIKPDLGYSDSDGVTSGQSLHVDFNISANASQVTISQIDLSGEIMLATIQNVAAGNVSLPFTLSTGGNTGIKVTVIGRNGGVAMAQLPIFIDQVPLTAQWIFASNQTIISQVDTIPISFSSKLLSDSTFKTNLKFSRNGNVIPTENLHFKVLNDSLFNVYGLRQARNLPGDYQLSFNNQQVSKYSSGITGIGTVSVSWTVQSSFTMIPANPLPANITKLEYFIDTDPGFGNAHTVAVTPGTDLKDFLIKADIKGLRDGIHYFYVRTFDDWSLTNVIPFTVGAALPLTWISFSARAINNKKVQLNWITAHEVNTDHFDIERSNDGLHYAKIGTVPSSQNSSAEDNYTFTDAQPINGISYYRLKQVDIDDHFTYSIVIFIKINIQLLVQITGNPVHQNLHLKISGTDGKSIPITIIDASGKRYKTFMAGEGSEQINIENLSSGMYYLMYRSEGNTLSIPFTKQ